MIPFSKVLEVIQDHPSTLGLAGGAPVPSSGRPRRPTVPCRPGAPLELPSLDFAFGEAALAADLITA